MRQTTGSVSCAILALFRGLGDGKVLHVNELGFWAIVGEEPDRPALIDAGGRSCTFGELFAESNRLARGLQGQGLCRGDVVAVVLENCIEFVAVYLAAMQCGFYFTPVNTHLTPAEIAWILEDSGAKALVASERFAAACTEAADLASIPPQSRWSVGAVPGFRPLADLAAGQPSSLPDHREAGAAMLYTSGTTGKPKGVRRALHGADPNAAGMVGALLGTLFGIEVGRGVHLVAGPLYHTAPLTFAASTLHLGHCVVLMDKWTPEATLELIERHRVTNTHLVPTMFRRLLALPAEERGRHDVSSLETVVHAAAPCPVEVKRAMLEWWGPVIYEYYAAPEGGGTYVSPKEWLERPGTVGRAFPGAEVRIVDDDGHSVATGVPGTIYMRSPIGEFEYHNDPEKTDRARQDGMFTVGDVGYLDSDGYLFLCDRKTDMIISGGVNIYPAEIEAVLLAHPAVADVAVIGVPNDDWGEEVKAVVETSAASPVPGLEQELIAHCRERLAGYKCPASVDFVDHLPRAETGKLAKRLIRDRYWSGRSSRI